MPVNLLLCEGGENSPDVRVLTKLLAGRCQVLPMGGKYGMGSRIIARREALGRNTVFGLLDGDFVEDWPQLMDRPRAWRSSDGQIDFGWRWERKEIENYLLDPAVAVPALGLLNDTAMPAGNVYQASLEEARDQLGRYQAVRTALATSRVRFVDLPSSFGRKRGSQRYLFPDSLDEQSCREGLRATVTAHAKSQSVKCDAVEQKFAALLPEFLEGGARHASFLCAFSGKDLLLTVDAKLQEFGFPSARVFLEKVLIGMERATDDIGDWIPEWRELQRLADAV